MCGMTIKAAPTATKDIDSSKINVSKRQTTASNTLTQILPSARNATMAGSSSTTNAITKKLRHASITTKTAAVESALKGGK